MYYEEKQIDGVWYWRGAPDDDWTPFNATKLYQKLAQKDARIAELEQRLELWGTSLSGDRVKLDFGADGIACRDSTITLLEGAREGLLERIDELKGALKEIRTRLHTAGRRPEECYEMHIIDSVLMERG